MIRAPRAHLEGLTVQPEGEPSFQLDVRETAVELRPTDDPASTKVRVRGSFEFDAVGGAVPLRPTKSRPARAVMVTLGTASRLTRPWMTPNGLVVRAQLGVHVTIPTLPVTCEDLTVDVPYRRLEYPVSQQIKGRALFPRRRRMTLSRSPGSRSSITVLVEHRSWLPLRYLGQRDDAVHVEASWRDGARLRGWVAFDDVVWGRATSYGGTGGRGVGSCMGLGRSGPHAYNGPASIAIGTQVYARAGASPWATVGQLGPFWVILWSDREWARIMRAPGLGCDLGSQAWVRAQTVTPTSER